jgi:hypothetical protein
MMKAHGMVTVARMAELFAEMATRHPNSVVVVKVAEEDERDAFMFDWRQETDELHVYVGTTHRAAGVSRHDMANMEPLEVLRTLLDPVNDVTYGRDGRAIR